MMYIAKILIDTVIVCFANITVMDSVIYNSPLNREMFAEFLLVSTTKC